jgi:hypothetical protein
MGPSHHDIISEERARRRSAPSPTATMADKRLYQLSTANVVGADRVALSSAKSVSRRIAVKTTVRYGYLGGAQRSADNAAGCRLAPKAHPEIRASPR